MSVNSANPTDVEEGQFTDTSDMGIEGKGIVKDNTKVSSGQEWVNVHVANLDAGLGRGLKES